MPNRTTDPATRGTRGAHGRRVRPGGLSEWLAWRLPAIAADWVESIQARRTVVDADWDAVVRCFLALLSEMIAPMIGPMRTEVEPLWTEAAVLFGAAAAGRGLAAGEAIEEIQMLRELLIKRAYEDAGGPGGPAPSVREVLLLNRAIDLAVTHASVGHTDALFFQLLENREDRQLHPVRMAEEAVAQLAGVRQALDDVLRGPRPPASQGVPR